MSEQENENKEIEVVKGDGSELDFSPVYEHLNAAKPKPKDEKRKILLYQKLKRNNFKMNGCFFKLLEQPYFFAFFLIL